MLNYMSQDRPDLSFASKEVSRGMEKPTQKDVVKLKRIIGTSVRRKECTSKTNGRVHRTRSLRTVTVIGLAAPDAQKYKRRSLDARSHLVHHLSSTQKVVALSSAEAELNAIVKRMTEILCLMNMMKECGRDPKGQILTDSSAANGIVHRQGCGKVKHLECRQHWVQVIVGEGKVTCTKVARLNNPADVLTHYWSYEDGRRHFKKLNLFKTPL